jgi:hypothetical protein
MKRNCASSWLFTKDKQTCFTGFEAPYPGKNLLTNVSETTSASLPDHEDEDNGLIGNGQISTGLQGFTSKAEAAACYTDIPFYNYTLCHWPRCLSIDCTTPCSIICLSAWPAPLLSINSADWRPDVTLTSLDDKKHSGSGSGAKLSDQYLEQVLSMSVNATKNHIATF